jgi:hypothetical protein
VDGGRWKGVPGMSAMLGVAVVIGIFYVLAKLAAGES